MNIRVTLTEKNMRALGYQPQVSYQSNGEAFTAVELAAWHGSSAALLVEALKGGGLDPIRRLALGDQLEGHMAAQQAWAEAHKGDLEGAISASEQVLSTIGDGPSLDDAIARSEGIGWPGTPGRTWIEPIWGEGAKAAMQEVFKAGGPIANQPGMQLDMFTHRWKRTDGGAKPEKKGPWHTDPTPSPKKVANRQADFHAKHAERHQGFAAKHTQGASQAAPDSKEQELHQRAAEIHRGAHQAHTKASQAHRGEYQGQTSAEGLSRQAQIESSEAHNASHHAPFGGGGGGGGGGDGSGGAKHGTHSVGEKLFGYHPNLRKKWGGGVEVLGDYHAPGQGGGHVTIRNKNGDTMAIRRSDLAPHGA